MLGLSTTLKWMHPSQSGSGSDGYFVTLTPNGVTRASYPDDVIGISVGCVNPLTQAQVGYIGVFTVRDDGSCTPGKKCTVASGEFTGRATAGDRWYVLGRMDDNSVKVLFK
jgi:hypothetical protein